MIKVIPNPQTAEPTVLVGPQRRYCWLEDDELTAGTLADYAKVYGRAVNGIGPNELSTVLKLWDGTVIETDTQWLSTNDAERGSVFRILADGDSVIVRVTGI